MKVIFWDKVRETHKAVDKVIQIETNTIKHNGRYTNFWFVLHDDLKTESYKQKDYEIIRVEA